MNKKFLVLILYAFCLTACTKEVQYDGIYATKGYFEGSSYFTLQVEGKTVHLEKDNLLVEIRDTITLHPSNFYVLKTTKVEFSILALKPYQDSIILTYQHDAGTEDIVFYKIRTNEPKVHFFSQSNLSIYPKSFNAAQDSLVSVDQQDLLNICIGKPNANLGAIFKKDTVLAEIYGDCIISEFENSIYWEAQKQKIVCLHIDSTVDSATIKFFKNRVKAYGLKVLESRLKDRTLVYIQ